MAEEGHALDHVVLESHAAESLTSDERWPAFDLALLALAGRTVGVDVERLREMEDALAIALRF